MTELNDGKDRESMVKYAVSVINLFQGVNKYDIVFMLAKQFPQSLEHTLSFIVDDAYYLIEKQKRFNKPQ